MNKYYIQHRIKTLSQCAVMKNKDKPASFESEGINFSHLDFNYKDGWLSDYWIAYEETESMNITEAINKFMHKLAKITSRISLISQSYIEYVNEPFIVKKEGINYVYFRYTKEFEAVGLMFMENEQKALEKLMKNKDIPDEFYYYWNDAVNAPDYTSKLKNMFSAVECLIKKGKKIDWEMANTLLGKELKEYLYGTKEKSETGLRHRLTHVEYLKKEDTAKDYSLEIHKKIISYFNDKILKEKLINEDVVEPQRNFYGNKRGGAYFIKKESGSYDLREILEDFDNSNGLKPDGYEFIYEKGAFEKY